MVDNEVTGTLPTATGPLPADTLGVTLVHEHVHARLVPPRDDTPQGWESVGLELRTPARDGWLYDAPLAMDRLGDVWLGAASRDNWTLTDERLAAEELTRYRHAGGGAIVDAATPETGRDVAALKRISQASGVPILASTGCRATTLPLAAELGAHADALRERIVGEFRDGIDGSGIRPVLVVESGALGWNDDGSLARLRALAGAAAEAGAPLRIASRASVGDTLAAVDAATGAGLDPAALAVSAHRFALDAGALDALDARGVWLAFDRFGRIPNVLTEVSDHDAAIAILGLAERGHGDRLLVSQSLDAKISLDAYGGPGYGFLLDQFVAYARGLGANAELLHELLTTNPTHYLTRKAGTR